MRSYVSSLPIVLLLPTILIFGALSIAADTIYVCWDGSGDYLTIQEGIDAAVDGDEVVVCDGTYTGAGNYEIDYHGKAITLRSVSGPENCIIDASGERWLFTFGSGETETSVLDGFTICNAYNTAIFCGGLTSPIIRNCIVRDNEGYYGGGICTSASSATIIDCWITGNVGDVGGGVCCVELPSPTLINCLITNNDSD